METEMVIKSGSDGKGKEKSANYDVFLDESVMI